MQYFETNSWSAHLNRKALTSPWTHSWFKWQSFSSSFIFLKPLYKLRLSRYGLISFCLNPANDWMLKHFPKGQDKRTVGRDEEFNFPHPRKAVFGVVRELVWNSKKSLDFTDRNTEIQIQMLLLPWSHDFGQFTSEFQFSHLWNEYTIIYFKEL